MEIVLAIALTLSIIETLVYRVALKAWGIYFQKKGYNQPTDDELKECSRIALKRMFKIT